MESTEWEERSAQFMECPTRSEALDEFAHCGAEYSLGALVGYFIACHDAYKGNWVGTHSNMTRLAFCIRKLVNREGVSRAAASIRAVFGPRVGCSNPVLALSHDRIFAERVDPVLDRRSL